METKTDMWQLISQAVDTPWKAWNEWRRWLVFPRVRLLFALNGISWGHNWRFYGVPIVQKHRRSTMRFGPGLQLRSDVQSNPLGSHHPSILATTRPDALLTIGDNFAMTGGSICASRCISIGNDVILGANATIVDTDFHPLDWHQRRLTPNAGISQPVVIESNVFIGTCCLILKGVTIGEGSVIGAGSVVTRSVPTGTICAGNPAKVVRSLL